MQYIKNIRSKNQFPSILIKMLLSHGVWKMETLTCLMDIMSLVCSFRETQNALLLFLISSGPGNHCLTMDRGTQLPHMSPWQEVR